MLLKKLIFILVACVAATLAQAQIKTEGGLLLDPQDRPVSKEAFMKLLDQPEILLVKNDSLPIYKAVLERSETGTITNYEEIISVLTQANIAVDRTKPIAIFFYPGKDRCNSSGSASRSYIRYSQNKSERDTKRLAQTSPLHLYRTSDGLERYKGITTWQKDPQQIIEKTFFKFHYPCGSYVIISPQGKYVSYFGEFSHDLYASDLKFILDK